MLFILIPGFDQSGPSKHLIADIIQNCCNNDVHVDFLSYKQKGKGELEFIPCVQSSNFAYKLKERCYLFKSSFIKRYIYDLWLVLKLIPDLHKYRMTSKIHLYASHYSWLLITMIRLFTKADVILNVQDIFPLNASYSGVLNNISFIYKVLNRLQNYCYRKATSIITISSDMKEMLFKIGVEKNKVYVIYNWAEEIEVLEGDKINGQLDIIKEKDFILYAGNIGTVQNLKFVLDLFITANISDLYFVIIGDGNEKSFLVETYKSKHILFFDRQSSEVAKSLYYHARVNVIPLLNNIIFTALPSKTPICLMAGKPIIAVVNAVSHYAKTIRRYNRGYVIDTYDENGIDAFKSALGDVNASNGKDIINEVFDKKKNLKLYLELLKEDAENV